MERGVEGRGIEKEKEKMERRWRERGGGGKGGVRERNIGIELDGKTIDITKLHLVR